MSTTLLPADQDQSVLFQSYQAQAEAVTRLCHGLVTVVHEPKMLIEDDDDSQGQVCLDQ